MPTVSARIDEQTKKAADYYLDRIGLTTSAAINVFFKQIVISHGLPFVLRVPDAVSITDFDATYPEYQEFIDDVSEDVSED